MLPLPKRWEVLDGALVASWKGCVTYSQFVVIRAIDDTASVSLNADSGAAAETSCCSTTVEAIAIAAATAVDRARC